MIGADVDKLSLAVLVALPELEAASASESDTLNFCDWARIPPLGERRLN